MHSSSPRIEATRLLFPRVRMVEVGARVGARVNGTIRVENQCQEAAFCWKLRLVKICNGVMGPGGWVSGCHLKPTASAGLLSIMISIEGRTRNDNRN